MAEQAEKTPEVQPEEAAEQPPNTEGEQAEQSPAAEETPGEGQDQAPPADEEPAEGGEGQPAAAAAEEVGAADTEKEEPSTEAPAQQTEETSQAEPAVDAPTEGGVQEGDAPVAGETAPEQGEDAVAVEQTAKAEGGAGEEDPAETTEAPPAEKEEAQEETTGGEAQAQEQIQATEEDNAGGEAATQETTQAAEEDNAGGEAPAEETAQTAEEDNAGGEAVTQETTQAAEEDVAGGEAPAAEAEAEEPPTEEPATDTAEQAADEQEAGKEENLEVVQDKGDVVTEAVGTATEPSTEPVAEVDPHAPSPGPLATNYDKDATATVKFVLMPGGQVATLRCHLSQTLSELKQHFSNELKMPVEVLVLNFDGRTIDDQTTLGDLGVGPNGTIRLEMQSSDPINEPLKPFKPRQEYHMPDVITVRVPTDQNSYMEVVVEIERTLRKKPFLGGYRHKETGVEYHHASAQTMQKARASSSVEKFCRDTQTHQQRHIFQQTTNSTSTQMTGIGVYVSNMSDRLMVPGKYTTADEHKARMLDKVVVIQKYYRRWLARRYVDKVRVDKARRHEWERQEEVRKRHEKEERIKREFQRRMNPKTKEDFDLLYHALEKWRHEEVTRINQELTGAERKAALCQLLEQETQLIASVGRHKLEADAENRKLLVQKFLDKAASPKKWRGPDGKMTEMDTPYTIRAQQLRDIYNSISMKYLTQDERLDVLLTLKHTVKEHDCKLTQEIIELIDREADLLMRGVKESNLDGLRKRISTLFLQYIKTPTFNPEAARLIKVPQDPSALRRNIYFCSSCNQYLPSTEFQLSSNSRAVGKCRACCKTDNDARVRQDYSHYRFLLKNLRRQEDAYGDGSKIAFLLQENDLRHLVENVWNSQSILSAWDDLYDLTLVRWIRTDEWSPWNCILLTKEEASAHEKLENLEEAYGKVFIHRVKHKHTLAHNYFSRLPGMAEHMRVRAASSALSGRQGPSVSGKSVSSVQGSAIKAQ